MGGKRGPNCRDLGERALKASVGVFCVAGFAVLTWGQCEKFVARKTSVSSEYARVERQRMPNLAICSADPFRPDAEWTADAESNLAVVPDVVRAGVSSKKSTPFEPADVAWSTVDTVYNGRCRLMTSNVDLSTGDFLEVAVNLSSSVGALDVFVVSPGYEIFLVFQMWDLSSVRILNGVDRTTLVSMYATRNVYLEGAPDGLDCRGSEEDSLAVCATQYISDRLIDGGGFQCLPSTLAPFAAEGQPACNNTQSDTAGAALDAAARAMGEVNAGRICHYPCVIRDVDVVRSNINLVKGTPMRRDSLDRIYFHFTTSLEVRHTQFYVHDLVSITSAIGGGLGLFLGFSCLNLLNSFVEAVMKGK